MSDTPEQQPPIRAGSAYIASIDSDPVTKQALAKAVERLRQFSESVKLASAACPKESKTVFELLAVAKDLDKAIFEQHQSILGESAEETRAVQRGLLSELSYESKAALQLLDDELTSYGFEPLAHDLESWEELARITEKEPGPMTMEEIYRWAIAWAKRELLRAKIARGETSPQNATNPKLLHPAVRSSEDASILRDENDPAIAWCIGKRVYLGNDTQVSRLFWLLASPVGRARSIAEVQQAVDLHESSLNVGTEEAEIQKSHQRIRKAISKLRAALLEASIDDHLLITRSGSQKDPEYSMLLRFG